MAASSSSPSKRIDLFDLTPKHKELMLEEKQINGKWIRVGLPIISIKLDAHESGKVNVVSLASILSSSSPDLEVLAEGGYICDFFVEGISNNSPFNFEVGTTLTKDVVKLLSAVSANSPNVNKKHFDEFLPLANSRDPADQIFSGKILPMHTEGAIHTAMRDEVERNGVFKLPKPIRLLPTGGNAFPMMVNMFAGVTEKTIDNTVRLFSKDSNRRVIFPNTLIGHRIKSMVDAFFVYHGEKMEADTPVEMVVNSTTFMTARTALLEQAKQVKEHLVKNLDTLDVILTSKEFDTTWCTRPDDESAICNRFTMESIKKDFQVIVKLKLSLVVYVPTVKSDSCAMDLVATNIWYRNIWNIKDIVRGQPSPSAIPAPFTAEYKMMTSIKQQSTSNKRKNDSSPSSSSSSSSSSHLEDDNDE